MDFNATVDLSRFKLFIYSCSFYINAFKNRIVITELDSSQSNLLLLLTNKFLIVKYTYHTHIYLKKNTIKHHLILTNN